MTLMYTVRYVLYTTFNDTKYQRLVTNIPNTNEICSILPKN
jgi:hypothetical protein